IRLSERMLLHDPPTERELQAAREVIKKETEQVRTWLGDFSRATFAGTAGTITTLAAMAQQLPVYEQARIHNYGLKLATVQKLEAMAWAHPVCDCKTWPSVLWPRGNFHRSGEAGHEKVSALSSHTDVCVHDSTLHSAVLICANGSSTLCERRITGETRRQC